MWRVTRVRQDLPSALRTQLSLPPSASVLRHQPRFTEKDPVLPQGEDIAVQAPLFNLPSGQLQEVWYL